MLLGLVGGVWLPNPVSAQVVYSYYPPPPTPIVTYSARRRPAVGFVLCSRSGATVTYYTPAPTVTYYQPAPPTITYSYYSPPPVTTVYAAPAPVYAPTTVVTPGYVTTRSYVGLGIFRPFGINRETYVSPGSRTTYYSPVYP